jgi:hypothetical protein
MRVRGATPMRRVYLFRLAVNHGHAPKGESTMSEGQQLLFTELQRVAYHEAGHVVARLKNNLAFEFVCMRQGDDGRGALYNPHGPIVERNNSDTLGYVQGIHRDWRNDVRWFQPQLDVILAGPCASWHLRPDKSFAQMIHEEGGQSDWEQALQLAAGVLESSYQLKKFRMAAEERGYSCFTALSDKPRFVFLHVQRVRQLVKDEWHNIVTLGDALIAAPERKLDYYECRNLLGVTSRLPHDAPWTRAQSERFIELMNADLYEDADTDEAEQAAA